MRIQWMSGFNGHPLFWCHFWPFWQAIIFPTLPLWAFFRPFHSLYLPKSICGPLSVLHEIDRIEQRNIHDWSEKFPLPNFMLKTASLQKVKKSRKFHYIWHRSTNCLLAPTSGGPNFFFDIFIRKLRSSAFQNTPWFWHSPYYSWSNIQGKFVNEIALHPKLGDFNNFFNLNHF